MKLNKSKNKGKVHPSPSSSSSSTSPPPLPPSQLPLSTANDTVSTLNNLLPTAILTLISILSLQDKQVLAYMITHSLSSTTNGKNPCSGKKPTNTTSKRSGHKIPSFDCGCFECYTSYWFRWDSSPNRELIHQAIDAFEEHLSSSEQPTITTPSTKTTRRRVKKFDAFAPATGPTSTPPVPPQQHQPVGSSGELSAGQEVGPSGKKEESLLSKVTDDVSGGGGDVAGSGGVQQHKQGSQQQQQHKGLARKVLPDVIGLFNSRLWNLWGPNV